MNRFKALAIVIPDIEALTFQEATDLQTYITMCFGERVSYVGEPLNRANVVFFSNDLLETKNYGKRLLYWWKEGKIEIIQGMEDFAIELPRDQIPEGQSVMLSNDGKFGMVSINQHNIVMFKDLMVLDGDGVNVYVNAKLFEKRDSDNYLRIPVETEIETPVIEG